MRNEVVDLETNRCSGHKNHSKKKWEKKLNSVFHEYAAER